MLKYILLLSVVCVSYIIITYPEQYDDSPKAIKYQQIADNIENIIHNIPDIEIDYNELLTLKPAKAFDPNVFLKVLKNIKLKDNYVLDYYIFQVDAFGGSPILYARNINDKPFINYMDHRNKLLDVYGDEYYKDPYKVENFIELNKTEQSYFEYAIFSVLSDQFYLAWHGYYNDWQIVCTKEKLTKVLNNVIYYPENSGDSLKAIRIKKSLEPIFEDRGDMMKVSINMFSKWGGLITRKFFINKKSPYTIEERRWQISNYLNIDKPDTIIKYRYHLTF